jgi:GDP/UDP-N,N'-diacetylbacillosamine 2-epimerase (hydrolysing)
MSQFHFVATEEFRNRVIQLGENPENVFNVGGLGVDSILNLKLQTRIELEEVLHFKLRQKNFIITFHPGTLDGASCIAQMDELLLALNEYKDIGLIFTMPNADTESRSLYKRVSSFCESNPNARVYKSLGQLTYLSCIKHFDGVIGNSSSGLTEAPTLKTGTINIGDRQDGRLRATSVIDCVPESRSISEAIKRLLSEQWRSRVLETKNPYGDGGASDLIVEILEKKDTQNILKKRFYSSPYSRLS